MKSKLVRASSVSGAVACVLSVGTASCFAQAETEAEKTEVSADQYEGLQSIVVTAQRREQNLQDVPISVSAITAESLENLGIENTQDLTAAVPAIQFTRSGPSGLFFIRGVGTTNPAAGEEGANAFYVDGVYLPDLFQAVNTFNNIERVEVLKGPQGTLFGRNATGGLVHIITKEPGETLEVKAQAGYANYETSSGRLYIGGPLGEGVAADIALTAMHQDEGWGDNPTRGEDTRKGEYWGARSKLVLEPTDRAKFVVSGDYFDTEDNRALAWRLAEESLGLNIVPGADAPSAPDDWDTRADAPSLVDMSTWGLSLTGTYGFDRAELTSITSYRENENHNIFDADGGELPLVDIDYTAETTAFQQEVRIASTTSGAFGWQAGAFYLHSKASNRQSHRGQAFALQKLLGADVDAEMETDSYAVFGEATYNVAPRTELVGGVRYTADERSFDGEQGVVLPSGVPVIVGSRDDDQSYDAVTWRVAARHDLTSTVNLYASVNRGFKAGSFSLQNPTAAPVDPQYITAYEVGLKSELFDNRLRLNLSGYHYDISDYQVRSAAVANPGSLVLLNAADVTVEGFDLDFDAAVTGKLRVFGGFTLLDSTFDSFENAPFVYPNPAVCDAPGSSDPGRVVGEQVGGLFTSCIGDASGSPTPLAPDFTGSLGATYVTPLGNRGELRLSGLLNHNAGYNFEFDDFLTQDSFTTLNVSAEYRPAENWGVEIWGKNVTEEEYFTQKLSVATGALTTQAAPATFGINLKYDY